MHSPAPGTPALEARDLAKRYGDVVALDGIDLAVHRGSCLGLLGPNGAGKTTTVEIFVGLLAPDRGHVRVLGETWRAR
jgi:ABC-2 type transport system ATP-binding protein